MSLYTSVYWTKRGAVVLALIVFFCSGWKIFTFVTNKFTQETRSSVLFPPEEGFIGIDRLSISPFPASQGFAPKDFRLDTINGKYDVDNGVLGPEEDIYDYPKETDRSPIANVYKILDKPIELNSTELPRKIAQSMGFTREPLRLSPTYLSWSENNRKLDIDGQYLTVNYDNYTVKTKDFSNYILNRFDTPESIKSFFEKTLQDYDIKDKDSKSFENYSFYLDYVDYDKTSNKFIPSGSKVSGQFVRLSAKRIYNNLVKPVVNSKSYAVYPYPQYLEGNNYIIVGQDEEGASPKDLLVQMRLYNWPINQENPQSKDNKDVQTYSIKTPREAFEELKNTNKYLISATEAASGTHQPINSEDLEGVDRIFVRQIKLEMFEDTVNLTYIQPVYVFYSLVSESSKNYELVYIVPALILK